MVSASATLSADRPTWRGWIHAVTFFAAIPGGVLLIVAAQSAAAIVEAIERVGALDERIAQQDADIAARIAGRWPRE